MGLNKSTNDFMNKLADLINNSGLPPVNVRLALDSARAQVAEIEKKAIDSENEQDIKDKEKAANDQAEEPEENS